MKRFLKISSYVLLAIVFSISLSGCTKTTKEDPKLKQITVWSFEDEDVWKPVAKSFAIKYKGYSLIYQKQTFDAEYESRVLNALLSNQGPDVWNMPSDWVYRHKDKLVGMSKTGAGIDKYVQSLAQSVTFDDKVYAISPYEEPLMVFYNQKIFNQTLHDYNDANTGNENLESRNEATTLLKQVPGTWTDFIKTVNLITLKGDDGQIELSGVALGTNNITNSADVLYLLMMENQTDIVSPDLKQANFNLPVGTPKDSTDIPGLRALEFYTSFADPSSDNYSWDDTLGDDVTAFAEGRTAMIFGYSNLQNYLAQKYPNFSYKKAFAPQLTSESAKVVDYAKNNVFGVSALTAKYDKKKEACWNLLNLLSAGTPSDGFNSSLKVYTSRKTSGEITFDDRDTANPEKVSLFTAKALVKGKRPLEFDRIIKASITAVNEGTSDAQTALDTAARDITEMLRQGSW